MDNNNQNRNNGKKPGGPGIWVMVIVLCITLAVVSMMNSALKKSQSQEVSYDEFVRMIEGGEVEAVRESGSRLVIVPKSSSTQYSRLIQYYTVRVQDLKLTDRLLEGGVRFEGEDTSASSSIINFIVGWVLPSVLMIGLLYMMFSRMGGGGGIMGVGKSNAKVYVQKETGVTFADVAGEDEAKESLVEIVDFLHNPQKYTKIGAKLPKGALLVGPPGTGKTLLAKAVAGEAQVPFYSLSGSDFVEMFVGVGASRVRDLFKQAQQSAPCIIFIDEIDAIGRSRDSRFGGNDEREQTLNQLLSEMDGFDSSKGLLVMAATNRPEILDPALLRPGRFDRRVIVDKPDLKGRVNILKVHSKDVRLDETVDFEEIALATSGAVGADLANMMNEAAINAVNHGRQAVCQKDLFEAVELAGGFTGDARPEYLNLAEPVFDGMKILVPDEAQVSDPSWNGQTGSPGAGRSPDGQTGVYSQLDGTVPVKKVNINSASKEELMTLTGIGESRAADIIRYRTEEGAFSRIEDIMKVPGIKEASFRKLKDQIEV